jgi:uncharacterized protein YkwD
MNSIKTLFVLTAMAALAACGGGGSAPAPVSSPSPAPAPLPPGSVAPPVTGTSSIIEPTVPVAGNIIATAPTSTYVVGSGEKLAFDYLNAERIRDGFGALQQKAPLDTSSTNHVNYLYLNNAYSHFEVAGEQGFTGVNVGSRVLIETLSLAYGGIDKTRYGGVAAIKQLLNAPYHAAGLLSSTRDAGVGMVANTTSGLSSVMTNVNLSYKKAEGKQDIGVNDVLVYPCNGAVGVDRSMNGELPNPVPDRDLFNQPLGRSFVLRVREGQTIAIGSATFVRVSDGSAQVLRTPMVQSNDPNNRLPSNIAFVIADAPQAANTAYRLNVSGTNNGVSFSKSCTITTGS